MEPGDPDEPSREELESRVEQLEQTVSKMLPDRRGVLKGLGAAAIGGAAVGGATGGASGQSAAGQVGTESEPVDVEAASVAAQSVSTGEVNNNQINLTRLVQDGTYADILDAIANEPENNPEGTSHIIEPGTYTVDTQRTITWENREVRAEGTGRHFNLGAAPVTIEWDGADEHALNIGDGVNRIRGGAIRGIKFTPSVEDGPGGAFFFAGADANSLTHNWTFERVQITDFGGTTNPVDYADTLWNHTHLWKECGITLNTATVNLPDQTRMLNCIMTGAADPGFDAGNHFFDVGSEFNMATNTNTVLKCGAKSLIMSYKFEGQSGGSSVGIDVDGSPELATVILAPIQGFDTGVTVTAGPIHSFNAWQNITNWKIDFQGGNNSHNGSYAVGDLPPDEIRTASDTQAMAVKDVRIRTSSNFSGSPLPAGYEGIWEDDATITASTQRLFVNGPQNVDSNERYQTFDGTR